MTYYCGECKKECEVHLEDEGIGSYEFWGAKCRQTIMVLVSDCCDEQAYEDEDCTVEADAGDYAYERECERGDYLYEQAKDRKLEEQWEREHG